MRITRAAEYAVRCILYLSQKGRGELITRQEISEQADIPAKFLAKIAQELAKAHLIDIRQGAKGGFRLLKEPKEITLLQVVEIMIGEIYLNDCAMDPETCGASSNCAVNRIWVKARTQLRQTLAQEDFAKLAKQKSCFPILGLEPLIP